MQVKSEKERGVRMKSVGLLAVGYADLHLHQHFLQRQARWAEHWLSHSLYTQYIQHDLLVVMYKLLVAMYNLLVVV